MKNLANSLTLLRLMIIPVLVAAFYIPGMTSNFLAACLFAFASITDFFDGYIARSTNTQSEFGRCLDPIADKLIVVVAIVMLIAFSNNNLFILIPGLIIICREILVSGMREFLAEMHLKVPVTKLAKYKTALQMTSITMLLLGEKWYAYTIDHFAFGRVDVGMKVLLVASIDMVGKILFVISSILTIITGYIYLRVGIKNM